MIIIVIGSNRLNLSVNIYVDNFGVLSKILGHNFAILDIAQLKCTTNRYIYINQVPDITT